MFHHTVKHLGKTFVYSRIGWYIEILEKNKLVAQEAI